VAGNDEAPVRRHCNVIGRFGEIGGEPLDFLPDDFSIAYVWLFPGNKKKRSDSAILLPSLSSLKNQKSWALATPQTA